MTQDTAKLTGLSDHQYLAVLYMKAHNRLKLKVINIVMGMVYFHFKIILKKMTKLSTLTEVMQTKRHVTIC